MNAFARRVRRVSYCLAHGCGLGRLGSMPGTTASVAICPLIYVASMHLSPWVYTLIGVGAFVLGCFLCQQAIACTRQSDPKHVIWDEFVGMWMACVALPLTPYLLLAALVLFRLFDIFKPPPISTVEKKIPGGTGIMADDLLAGVITNLLLHCWLWFSPQAMIV